jgi:hypothetical protein
VLLLVGLLFAALPAGSALANTTPNPRVNHLLAGLASYRNLTPSRIESGINALDPTHPAYPQVAAPSTP